MLSFLSFYRTRGVLILISPNVTATPYVIVFIVLSYKAA